MYSILKIFIILLVIGVAVLAILLVVDIISWAEVFDSIKKVFAVIGIIFVSAVLVSLFTKKIN